MIFNRTSFNMKAKKMGAGVLCALLLCGCGVDSAKSSKNIEMKSTSFFAMDTVMDIQIAGDEELLNEAQQMVADLESKLSVTSENSEIGKINKDKIGRLSPESATIFKGAMEICESTEGALDISIYPVLKEWGFTTGEYHVPDEETIEKLLSQVGYDMVRWQDGADDTVDVVLLDDMEIDLGSVVKGYTGTALSDFFKENGVDSALINLGGNVQCIGTKQDGTPWKIAVKSPFPNSDSGIIGVLEAEDIAVVTSGGYERYFEEDNQIYWHILDPKTGSPAKNGLVSVTIVGKDGLMCDGLSTALFVKGRDDAIDYWKSHKGFDVILVTEDGEVTITEGIKDSFSLSPEYANSTLTVITR